MEKIDMSLEDIIKSDKSLRNIGRGGRGGNRGGRGNSRGNNTGNRNNNNSFRGNRGGPSRGGIMKRRTQQPKSNRNNQSTSNGTWKHDMFDGVGRSNNTSDGRLLVSNLDFGVNDSDIKELFSEFGPLRKAAVHYDRSARSSGTAEVHFEKRSDAIRALKQYNNVPLDGRSMDIKLVGADVLRDRNQQQRRPTNNNSRSQNRGSRGFSRGGGNRGRGGRNTTTMTSDELDKQLDAYNNKMDTE